MRVQALIGYSHGHVYALFTWSLRWNGHAFRRATKKEESLAYLSTHMANKDAQSWWLLSGTCTFSLINLGIIAVDFIALRAELMFNTPFLPLPFSS